MTKAAWVFVGAIAAVGVLLIVIGLAMVISHPQLKSECCPSQSPPTPTYPMANTRGER